MEFIQIEEKLFNLLNNARITEKTAYDFKQLLQDVKKNFGLTLSKQFFLNGLNRTEHKRINTRINRIIKKADIQIKNTFYYYSELTTIKGNLCKNLLRKTFNLLV
uniref:Uncharacterized protein n=1 Tax=candidate division CPR3 bacterium TaxID=2268181 RepID=A0A7C5YR80_UNCC3